MVENFQAQIGANIRDFQRAMREVDEQIRDTAMGADADIGADLSEFMSEMGAVNAILADLARENNVPIDADIDDFVEDAAIVRTTILSFLRARIVIPIEARVNKFSQTLGRIASFTRSFQELQQTTLRGIGMSLSPALVPIISSLVGLIGQLGPMIGVLAGSTFALGSAFATAGIGAAGFGAIAVTNLKDIFGASSDLKNLQEQLNDADTWKERNKIMKEMKAIQSSLNAEQTKALKAMDGLKDIWSGIAKGLQSKTIQVFTKALGLFGGVLKSLSPMFTSVTDSVNRLMDNLGKSVKSDSMIAIFNYLNTTAGPMLEIMAKSFGNFIKGILSMFVAFKPLTESTSKGFLAMSESFAEWSDGLGKSKKFQAFMDYVNDNMPKIRSIFSDAFQGIINLFAGFGPSSADMMTSLEAMMKRFKEWSSTISTNQGFQNFIKYVKENGPKVIAAIGNIVTAIVNIGIALAPMGTKILEMVNGFIEWTNSMMENHPILGKIGAAVLVITGLLIAIAPNIIAFGTLFGGVATLIMTKTALMRASFVLGMKMMITSMLAAGKQMVITAAQFVAKWVVIGAQSLVNAAKVAAAWLITKGTAMVTAVASMIATAAVMVAKWVWMGVQALAQAARMAAAWFIALGPVGWVIGAIVALAILIIANWDKIKESTIKIWKKVSEAVKEAWENVKEKTSEAIKKVVEFIGNLPGKVKEFVGDMKQAGSDLIAGVIKGITGKIGEGLEAVGGFAKSLLARFKKDTDTRSPSRAFANIAEWFAPGVVKGIDKTSHLAINSVSDMASRLTNAFNPQLEMADMQVNASLNTAINRADMRTVKHSFAADISDLELEDKGDTYLIVDGRELGKVVANPVREENERYDKQVKLMRGGR